MNLPTSQRARPTPRPWKLWFGTRGWNSGRSPRGVSLVAVLTAAAVVGLSGTPVALAHQEHAHGVAARPAVATPAGSPPAQGSPRRTFTYGYDLAKLGPYNAALPAAQAGRQVMASYAGVYVDIPIMGWGLFNPEPSPGVYDFSQIARRVALVQSTGGIPVITLSAAPDWMKGGTIGATDWTKINMAPVAQHYQDFATLSAKVAQAFPQVKSFVVWKEFQGFWDHTAHAWNSAGYTAMYNDVYQAVKAVRPDASMGGPYVSMQSISTPGGAQASSPTGPWGTVMHASLDAVSFWLANKVGAEFLAVDGTAFTKDAGLITDPLTSTEKYAAVDRWLTSRTALPIMWMESHLLPIPSVYTDQQQAAIRVASLLQMATSGASVGLQWQAESEPGWDEGLWTSTASPGGGQLTVLGQELPPVLAVLSAPVTLVPGEPAGVMAASGARGTVTVTLSGTSSSVVVTPAQPAA